MARRDANLAGLAALGALGYQLYNQGKDKGGAPVEDRVAMPAITGDDQYNPDVKYAGSRDMGDESGTRQNMETGEFYSATMPAKPTGPASAKTAGKKTSPAMMSRESEAAIRAKGGSRGTRYLPADESAYKKAQEYAASPAGREERKRQEESQAIENMTGDFLPVGRIGKAVGTAAKSARTALATRAAEETPVTFMGASGRRAVGEAERLGAPQKRLRGPEGKDAVKDTVDTLPPAKRALEYTVPEFGRDAVTNPMYWMSGGKAMKKGGAVKAKSEKAEKPSAKGWGKARGVRAAKYY